MRFVGLCSYGFVLGGMFLLQYELDAIPSLWLATVLSGLGGVCIGLVWE